MNIWQRLINIPSTDPDDARRKRLLNIILLGMFVGITLVSISVLLLYTLRDVPRDLEFEASFPVYTVLALAGFAGIYAIGRFWSGKVASTIFLLFMVALLFMSDSIEEVISGRSTLYFVIPIIIASVLLRPSASFIFAGVVIVANIVIALSIGLEVFFFAPTAYLIVALVSWLAAQSLERALKDLRTINQELDQRVADRTRELQSALQREQAEAGQSRAILQSLRDCVMVFDPQGQLVVANPVLTELTGKLLPELTGQKIDVLMANNVTLAQKEMVLASLQKPAASEAIYIDWGERTLSLKQSAVLLESGETIGTVIALHDVTKELEASRVKNAFVAMVSHELRTPLSVISGMVEILQEDLYGTLTEKQQDVVQRLKNSTQKLSGLVRDLLDQAKIEAGTLSIQETPISPAILLSEVEEASRAMVVDKGLNMMTRIEAEVPEILFGDLQRLQQVLVNLVTNAVKFTSTGEIRVRIYCPDETHWGLEVSDTGDGIAPDAQEHIFEPFWQADNSIGRKRSGAGLGLSIVKKLVDLMQGEIQLHSAVGRGSTFNVLLPLRVPTEHGVEKHA